MKRRLDANSPIPLFVLFAIASSWIYFPALSGEFVSDDVHYVQDNGYVHTLSPEYFIAIVDPLGPLPRVVENYAPVHLLLHSLAWQAFGADVRGHHLVNIGMHALAACLLVTLFRRSGVPALAAFLGGAFFLVHPANVEAVAWISQLKTTSAMVLCLAALLQHPRRPALAAALFALGLLAKPSAVVALFVVAAFGLVRPRPGPIHSNEDGDTPPAVDWRWGWIALWGLFAIAFAIVELHAFEQTAGRHPVAAPDVALRIRTAFAVAVRYLAMATTSHGLSVFQEPEPPRSLVDAWWLASLPIALVIAGRFAFVARQRRIETAYWVWAAAAFAPICGLIPLPHTIADRYLYFMLPGLIGAALLAGIGFAHDPRRARSRRPIGIVLTAAAVVWIAAFALRGRERAAVWQSSETLTEDLMLHQPHGRWAHLELAARATEAGDRDAAMAHLQSARARGFDQLDVLLGPRYAPLVGHAGFVELARQMAESWIARIDAIRDPTQSDLMVRAQAQIALGRFEAARDDLRRALYRGGPDTPEIYQDLERLRLLEDRWRSSGREVGD